MIHRAMRSVGNHSTYVETASALSSQLESDDADEYLALDMDKTRVLIAEDAGGRPVGFLRAEVNDVPIPPVLVLQAWPAADHPNPDQALDILHAGLWWGRQKGYGAALVTVHGLPGGSRVWAEDPIPDSPGGAGNEPHFFTPAPVAG